LLRKSSAVRACHIYAVILNFLIAASKSEWADEIAPLLFGGQSMSSGESFAIIIAKWSGGVWRRGT
jgi:hypothetical protein